MANASTIAPVSVTQTQSSPDLNLHSDVTTLWQLSSPRGKKCATMKDIQKTAAKVCRVGYLHGTTLIMSMEVIATLAPTLAGTKMSITRF